MKRTLLIFILVLLAAFANGAYGQAPPLTLTRAQEKKVTKAFETANAFMDEGKYGEALKYYQEGLSVLPGDTAMLYNGGMAAFNIKNFETAAELWKRLKAVDPNDGQARSKLVQVYQALNKFPERDKERDELFDLWKSKKSKEFSERDFYCREQFESSGYKPTPKEGERLFHLDGYFMNGHATYGMYHPAPTYDETRSIVVKILEGKAKPVSSSTRAQ